MTRTHITVLLSGCITGGLLIGLTACGSTDTTTVSSTAPGTTVASTADPVSTSADPTTTLAATSTTSLTTVAVNSAKPSTTAATAATTASTAAASKPDFSAVLALVDSAEQSGAGADKELNTANNAMNSTEQDPQS